MSKKNFSSLLLLSFLISTQLLSAWNVKKFLCKPIDNYKIPIASISSLFYNSHQFKVLGSSDVCQNTKNLVRGILRELDFKHFDQIYIKQMSPLLAKSIGKNNALATSNAIFIDEEYLATLSPSEQRALIGHECMHIKNKDVLRTLIVIGLMEVTNIACFSWTEKSIKNLILRCGCNTGIFITLLFLVNAFCRYQEKSADKQAAKLLQCFEGGIALNKKFVKRQSREQQSANSYSLCLKRWLNRKFAIHPLPEERIAYLMCASNEMIDV